MIPDQSIIAKAYLVSSPMHIMCRRTEALATSKHGLTSTAIKIGNISVMSAPPAITGPRCHQAG
jgi:hypothetical protein